MFEALENAICSPEILLSRELARILRGRGPGVLQNMREPRTTDPVPSKKTY